MSNTIISSLEQQANSQKQAGHYKEAIALYKKIWLETDDINWHQQIAECYLQRALVFSERGMFNEALALWDDYTHYAKPPYRGFQHYIGWVIESNDAKAIKTALSQLTEMELDKDYPDLAVLLGFLMLTEYPNFEQLLPQNSVFIAHYRMAQQLIVAYLNNDSDLINTLIKQIPYRSAFKDFRHVLTCVIAGQNTHGLERKIAANSPYLQTARLLTVCYLDGAELLLVLAKLNYRQRRLVVEIKGFSTEQQQLIEYLVQHQGGWTDKIKFNAVIQSKVLFDKKKSPQFCQGLVDNYAAGTRDFNKTFADVSVFELNRLKALNCEHTNKEGAEYYWKQCIEILINDTAENDYKIALIFRHLADQQAEPEEKNQLLIKSLAYDTDDLASYLSILSCLSQYDEGLQEYDEWLQKTLKKFPASSQVLEQAIGVEYAKKGYINASQYALRLLAIEPQHHLAKTTLFSCYLVNIRQLIKSKEHVLMSNEMERAESLGLGLSAANQLRLMQAYHTVVKDHPQGVQKIVDLLQQINTDPINATFQAVMEALLTGVDYQPMRIELPQMQGYCLSEGELGRLIQQIKQFDAEGGYAFIYEALKTIESSLLESLSEGIYTEKQWLILFQTLDSIEAYELLNQCAELIGLKNNKAICLYYQVYSACDGIAEKSSRAQIVDLEKSRELARENKEERAVLLIDSFLTRYYQLHQTEFLGHFTDSTETETAEVEDDPLEQLFSRIPENAREPLSTEMGVLAQNWSPEDVIDELAQNRNDGKQMLLAMMKEPDLYTGLLLVKAIHQLNMEIDLGVDDVVASFQVAE